MVYLQKHLLMPTGDPVLQWFVSKLHLPSSTSHWQWLATESLGTWLPPPRTISLSQKSPFVVNERRDLHRPLAAEHSGLPQLWEVGVHGWVQGQTCVICWWLTFGIWAIVVLWPQLDVTDLEQEWVQWWYQHGVVSMGSGTLVVCNVLSRRVRSWSRTSCWLSKSSSSILDEKVDSPES